jgi:general secretion pathway protein G
MIERIKASRKTEGEGGFTLIELLVVIIILGILAAVVVFAVGGIGDKGQSNACKIDTRTLRTAEEAYAGGPGNGAYTADEALLVSSGFLSEQSTLHNIVLVPGPPATFNVTVQDAKCGTVGGVAGTPGNF